MLYLYIYTFVHSIVFLTVYKGCLFQMLHIFWVFLSFTSFLYSCCKNEPSAKWEQPYTLMQCSFIC